MYLNYFFQIITYTESFTIASQHPYLVKYSAEGILNLLDALLSLGVYAYRFIGKNAVRLYDFAMFNADRILIDLSITQENTLSSIWMCLRRDHRNRLNVLNLRVEELRKHLPYLMSWNLLNIDPMTASTSHG